MSQKEVQIPRDYGSWKTMIINQCGETLSQDFINARLEVLKNPKDAFTSKFISAYGKQYWEAVVSWFERAKNDMI